MRKGWFADLIAKCVMCGARFWDRPFPDKCDRCRGAIVADTARGIW